MRVSRSGASVALRNGEPNIHQSASVHRFSNVVGPVTIGQGAVLGPGTSVRAEPDTPFHLGHQTHVNDGAVIHGRGRGRVTGDDDRDYAVWVGDRTEIGHLALVHGPAYIGAECFIGFRSTVFNAHLGDGCIVMMHALIQDVEVPPGRFVPSGSVVLTQEAADALPTVRPQDREFVAQLLGSEQGVRSVPRTSGTHFGTHGFGTNGVNGKGANGINGMSNGISSTNGASGQGGTMGSVPHRAHASDSYPSPTSPNQVSKSRGSVVSTSLSPELVQQVRQLLAQGYKVTAESADKRRFQTASWNSCALAQSSYETDVLSSLAACLSANAGQYVRLIGVDTANKRRAFEDIIQRPGDRPGVGSVSSTPSASASYSSASVAPAPSGGVAGTIAQQLQQYISQGYGISIETTTPRRFQVQAWTSCGGASNASPNQIFGELDACMKDNPGNYVRVLVVDTLNKSRVAELVVQRPSGPVTDATFTGGFTTAPAASQGATAVGGLDASVVGQIRNALASGHKITAEFTDARRYRINSWNSCSGVSATSESQAIAQIQTCMADHPNDYVRVVGVDPQAKRRVFHETVQRPNGQKASAPAAAATPSYSTPASNGYSNNGNGAASYGSSSLPAEVISQIQGLLSQGYKIGTEHADRRRFKENIWNSCKPIDATNKSQVVAALESCLSDHAGEYVRLIGIDTKNKSRVYEETVQRP